ncbi:uncharacterized protein LOC130724903 [Lotus japonicus]|uniref:uncharacterized protein LOC130724903 n=1 Tax=Lotus japonicus TaxID=34305 RepID=UPI0025904398|nr:uncharacterized protein LOC130724903 [Lotus japonicus]
MEEVQVRDQASAPAVAFPARWRRPGPGIIKCNFDAFFLVDGPAGMGMVARNSEGEVMAAACSYPLSIISPLLAEAVSMRWSMQLTIDLGFRRILLETDCLQLFKAWKAKEAGRSYLSSIISDCRFLVSAFDYVNLSFVRRTGNTVADFLARNAATYAGFVWVEEVPDAALPFIISDVTLLEPIGI